MRLIEVKMSELVTKYNITKVDKCIYEIPKTGGMRVPTLLHPVSKSMAATPPMGKP